MTIQAQIIELLAELQRELGTALIWITHDLGVVAGIADRVIVMYAGRVVEEAGVDAIYASPGHPYTRALLSAMPTPDPPRERARHRIILSGELPSHGVGEQPAVAAGTGEATSPS